MKELQNGRPLLVVPARQFSEGHPCKNRVLWPAMTAVLSAVPEAWGIHIVTDDPWIEDAASPRWMVTRRPMNHLHTIAQVVQSTTNWGTYPALSVDEFTYVVVLQLSSPTRNRLMYVRVALNYLCGRPELSSVISVVPWVGEPPSKACTLAEDGTLQIPPCPEARQAQPRHYRRDGTVYAVRREYAQRGDLYGPRPIPLLIHPDDSVTVD